MYTSHKTVMKRGFTLIEILLSVGMTASVIMVVSQLYSVLLSSRVKNRTVSEVDGQSAFVMEQLLQTVRSSIGVSSPLPGSSGASLTLIMTDPSKSPTIYDLSAGILRITEGSAAAVALTNSRVTVSALLFRNLSATGSAGTVRTQFTASHVNISGRNEYDYVKTVTGSATLRYSL